MLSGLKSRRLPRVDRTPSTPEVTGRLEDQVRWTKAYSDGTTF
jgi:hypothetical protein